ncbi:MAG: hypothetical protein ACRC5M_04400 [Anaeroplasmataceae bacterium]
MKILDMIEDYNQIPQVDPREFRAKQLEFINDRAIFLAQEREYLTKKLAYVRFLKKHGLNDNNILAH